MDPDIRRSRPIDGFGPPPKRPLGGKDWVAAKPRQAVQKPPAVLPPEPAAKPVSGSVVKTGRGWKSWITMSAVVVAGLVAGLFLQAIPLGYLAVVVYAIAAVIKRIPSRLTFTVSLGALLLAPVGIAIGSGAVANGFSLLGFLLLSVGVVTLGIELRTQKGGTYT